MNIDKRNIKYDIIKSIAAFLICIYHLDITDFGQFYTGQTYYPNFNKIILGVCSAGVPLFFVISGALALTKYASKYYFISKAISALKIYTIWSIICGITITSMLNLQLNLNNFLISINYLWFFQSLSFLYIFTILFNMIKTNKYTYFIPIIILICPFVINFLYDIFLIFDINIKPHRTGFFRLYSLLYFTLLFFYKPHFSFIKSFIFIILGLFLIALDVYLFTNYNGYIFDGVNSSFPTIGALFITLGIYCVFNNIEYDPNSRIVKIAAFWGKNCLGIYLFHMPIIVFIKQFLVHGKVNILYALFITIIIMTISSIVFYFLRKIQFIKWALKL